ncbi:MAG: hypothetical protein MUF61_00765 [archaeon]|jgi:hypothetical protein|nr:hypothetical protein [archaeon]
MSNIYKELSDEFARAESLVQSADHLVYVALPVVKDNRLLLRALEHLHRAVVLDIGVILKFEHLFKRINLTKDPKLNLEIFFGCGKRFGLNELDYSFVKEIMIMGKKHKESGFEFSRSGKVIILDDTLGLYELRSEKLKEYINMAKKLSNSVKKAIDGVLGTLGKGI